ncbi:FecR domain-containing protein [Nitrosomonas europaea]|uniref:FecR domain-containing protein n=1 Tax=Nitrosomonas europaea TaxID=915 RepID=UPI0023F4A487|nr:FecR family protein [Nitrosomonas europaea]
MNQPIPSHEAMEQAAEWFALLRSGEACEQDHLRWNSWLNSDPSHRVAWHYVEQISQRFNPIQTSPDPHSTAKILRSTSARQSRRRVLIGIGALAGSSLFGWATWRHTPLSNFAMAWMADHTTVMGEVREITLSDGTRVWLNTASAFNIDYRSDLRRLNLVTGEILIETATDPVRPLIVDTPQGRLHALGTRFTVRLEESETFLAVYEGAVRAHTTTGASIIVNAGQQICYTNEGFSSPITADPARAAWTQGILLARDIPLKQVVDELRRYRKGYLGIAPEVADLLVFGNFPLHDSDQTLAMLESVLPIRIQHTLPWWVSIEPRSSSDSIQS